MTAETELLACPLCADPMEVGNGHMIRHVSPRTCLLGDYAWPIEQLAVWNTRSTPALPEERVKLVDRLYDTMLWGIGGNRAHKSDAMKAAIRETLATTPIASLPDKEASGIENRMRWYGENADKRSLDLQILKLDCAEAASVIAGAVAHLPAEQAVERAVLAFLRTAAEAHGEALEEVQKERARDPEGDALLRKCIGAALASIPSMNGLREALENIAGHDAAANGLNGFAAELVDQLAGTARAALRASPEINAPDFPCPRCGGLEAHLLNCPFAVAASPCPR